MTIARHVAPSPRGGWETRKPGTHRPLTHHPGRDEALRHARHVVDDVGGGPVVELDAAGRVVGVFTAEADLIEAGHAIGTAPNADPTDRGGSRLAVATAFIAGVLAARRFLAKPHHLVRGFALGFGIGVVVFGDVD